MVGSANFFFNDLAHADPELVCDENDEPIGIRLNLPEEETRKIKDYLQQYPNIQFYPKNQIEFNNTSNITVDNLPNLAFYLLQASEKDFYIPGEVLVNSFFFYLQNILHFDVTYITCGQCNNRNSQYLSDLGKLLQEYF